MTDFMGSGLSAALGVFCAMTLLTRAIPVVSSVTAAPAASDVPASPAASAVQAAATAPLEVMSSTALKTVIEAIQSEFEQTTHQKLAVTYATSASLEQRIERGERFEVAILTPELLERLVSGGIIAAGSRRPIARAPMGMAIRVGARRPDVGTVEALKKTLVGCRSIAAAREGAAGIYFAGLSQRLGIAEVLGAKMLYKDGGTQVSEAVASGDAELGILPLSEIIGRPGVEVLGRFPPDVEGYAVMVAGVAAVAEHASAADKFLAALTGPAAATAMGRAGLERLH